MFKRITWMGIGMAVGATGAFRAKRKMEETIERYLPEQVADRAVTSARGVSQVVKAAATEGREVMRATETELRARVEARTFVGERPDAPAASSEAESKIPARPRPTRRDPVARVAPPRRPPTARPAGDERGAERSARLAPFRCRSRAAPSVVWMDPPTVRNPPTRETWRLRNHGRPRAAAGLDRLLDRS